MSAGLLGALLLGGALAMICAFVGALIGNSISSASRSHPSRLRRWLRRLIAVAAFALAGAAIAAVVAFAASSPLIGGLTWLAAFAAFALGYRFASGRRMLRALNSGIAVGLH